MWKKIAVIGGFCAVALGIGGVALASSGTAPSTAAPGVAAAAGTGAAAPSTGAGTAEGKHQKGEQGKRTEGIRKTLLASRVLHAEWVTKDHRTGTLVTHHAIRGTVSAVSSTAITVKAADNTTQTFAVTATTKVHVKGGKKGTPGTIGQVKVGDQAGVLGTGTGAVTATHVIDRGAPKPATSSTARPTR